MRIVTIKQLVSRRMWGLLIASVAHESNSSRLSVYEKVDYLQSINFLKLSNKVSVIVSAGISVDTSVKNEDIKTVSVLTNSHAKWSLDAAWVG